MNRREQWARNIAILTGLLVVLFAALFARLQNQPPSSGAVSADNHGEHVLPAPPTATYIENIATGQKIFEVQGCMRCHAIAGQGNPRLPLDTVGRRRSAAAIRQWIVADDEVKGQMSAGIFQTKQVYRRIPTAELDALVFYLQSIAANPKPAAGE